MASSLFPLFPDSSLFYSSVRSWRFLYQDMNLTSRTLILLGRCFCALQEKLDEANREYDREKQTIEHTEKTIKDKSGEAERLRREIETLSYDEHELKRLEETSDKHKHNFKDAILNISKSSQSAEDFEREVGAKNKELEQKKVKKMEVQKELK
jgi:hypothetical protein